MRNSVASLALLLPLWGSAVVAVPRLSMRAGNGTSGEHVVLVDREAGVDDGIAKIMNRVNLQKGGPGVKYVYDNAAFAGFSADLDEEAVTTLNAMTEVTAVGKSVVSNIQGTNFDTTWGLQRISSPDSMDGDDPKKTDFDYNYPDNRLGAGVDVYVLDTGVRTTHELFAGKATQPFTFNDNQDDNVGHGTHVCGTAGATFMGVASESNKISVKVLDQDAGTTADIIAGLDFVVNQHNTRKTQEGFVASVVSMSIGLKDGAIFEPMDQAVKSTTEAGVHVVVAAGNDNKDACEATPGRSGGANSNVISVGAINVNGDVSSFSNRGACVDVFAPGEEVLSASHDSDTATEFMQGTSMATPHVSGIVTYFALLDPALAQDTTAMKQRVKDLALRDIAPDGNIVAYNDGNGHPPKRMAKRQTPTPRFRGEVVDGGQGINVFEIGSPETAAFKLDVSREGTRGPW